MTREEFVYFLRKAGCVLWMHMIEEALTEHLHTLQITDEQLTRYTCFFNWLCMRFSSREQVIAASALAVTAFRLACCLVLVQVPAAPTLLTLYLLLFFSSLLLPKHFRPRFALRDRNQTSFNIIYTPNFGPHYPHNAFAVNTRCPATAGKATS